MLFNAIAGFIIPWLFGLYLFKKSPIIILITMPIASLVTLIINELGFYFKFWSFNPSTPTDESVSALPLDLGIYPVLACFMVFWIRKTRISHMVGVIVTTMVTTLLEYSGYLADKVRYGNGWNIFYTFLSYLVAYIIVYVYYRMIVKMHASIRPPEW
ncbi:CBO0543 family protein [Paenibacillus sp. DYY-L-2]|uniref:CBO0543 family protein n=1 Tax=Paenibacillus sp. DYY-L-2 TaxID=3447013 RepID=UPI003F4F5D60